ncbi:primase-helicase family protein [Pseudomonas fluorescens]|uniref:NrS-1 polymerase-like helicase domain-containing protein n=1 Tax=Pseudomonas fluorescens TaxID=294 RepID=A0A5E7EYS0_PSEFL|nr:primase-helicase family protein [Pseudomonas fluorescens]VVO32090.1 hypothetical protein PS691_05024 [Pseudomonas fluorescens]
MSNSSMTASASLDLLGRAGRLWPQINTPPVQPSGTSKTPHSTPASAAASEALSVVTNVLTPSNDDAERAATQRKIGASLSVVPNRTIEFGKGESLVIQPEARVEVEPTNTSASTTPAMVKAGDIDPESREILRYISEDLIMVTGEGPVVAYHIETGCRLSKEGLKHYCAKRWGVVLRAVEVKKGVTGWKSFPAGEIWWEWNDPQRRVVLHLVMEPTSLLEHEDNPNTFNLWHVLKREMAERNLLATRDDMVILWVHLLYISGGDVAGVTRFLCWLAWLYQHPEDKLPTAFMFYSEYRRVGKNLVGRLITRVFGAPLVLADGDGGLLTSKFDDALLNKRIAIINEVRLAGKDRDRFEVFKNRVSAERVVVEPKGRPAREVRNTVHYILTTNHEDALPLTDNEGRINVLRCLEKRKDSDEKGEPLATDAPGYTWYYEKLTAWIDGPGAGVFANVLATWDFQGWNPHAPAPQTAAAKDMQHAARGHGINFMEDRMASREGGFSLQIGRCLGVYNELNTLHPMLVRDYGIKPETLPGMFKKLGCKQLFKPNASGKPSSNPNTKVWCWANPEWWDQQPVSVWNDYITSRIPPEGMPPFGDDHE